MNKGFKKYAILYPLIIYFLLSVYFICRLIKVFFMSFISIFVKQKTYDNWINGISEDLSEYGIK